MKIPLTSFTTYATTFAVLAAAAPATRADFTPVHAPPGTEAGHASVLEAYYTPGTPWYPFGARTDSRGNPVDLTNGTLVARRVDDWGLGGVLDAQTPFFGEIDDQSWTGTALTINAVARYAGYTQEFGYDLDGDGLGYIKLFDVEGRGMSVAGAATLDLDPGQLFAWLRDGNHGGRWSSRANDNPDGRDHMVTYYVSGMNDELNHWTLFWEDLPGGGDQDYNDMVIEVTAPVPEPGAGLTVLLACGALAFLRRCA